MVHGSNLEEDGYCYEQSAILEAIKERGRSPMTNKTLKEPVPLAAGGGGGGGLRCSSRLPNAVDIKRIIWRFADMPVHTGRLLLKSRSQRLSEINHHKKHAGFMQGLAGAEVFPNYDKKSDIAHFKEQTVREILDVARALLPEYATEVSKLLGRAEHFLQPRLPDCQAVRNLQAVLQLRVNLPEKDRCKVVGEFINLSCKHAKMPDPPLQTFLDSIEESDLLPCIKNFSTQTVVTLQALPTLQPGARACQDLLDKELLGRYAGNLRGNSEALHSATLWKLVLPRTGVRPAKFGIISLSYTRWENCLGHQKSGLLAANPLMLRWFLFPGHPSSREQL